VPTDKRARQRAAREQKQSEIQKSRKRKRNTRRTLGLAVLAAAIVGIVFAVNQGSKAAAPTTTTTSTTTSTSTTTTSTTLKPGVPRCPPLAGSAQRVILFEGAPGNCITKTSVFEATFTTSLGNIVVSMPSASSYAAVNNFVFLARYRYYDKTTFHRVIPGFVVQGGDPWGDGTGGPQHYPGYSFTGNTPPASCKTKPNQAACYQPGDIAMANSTGPSTNGSQFFFVLSGGQKVLNQEPNYTIFGKVISGTNIMDKIGADGQASGTPKVKVQLLTVTVKQVAG
jgi:cyclophilin family peptidyl-prolyl cis-trans isomerase